MGRRRPNIKKFAVFVALVVLLALLYIFACRSSYQAIDGINEDTRSLLTLTTYNVLDLEKEKDYSSIYRQHFSNVLKTAFSEADFLKRANCLEKSLGDIDYYTKELTIQNHSDAPQPYYEVSTTETRQGTSLQVKLRFIQEGINFNLLQVHWDTENKAMLNCLRKLSRVQPVQSKKLKKKAH